MKYILLVAFLLFSLRRLMTYLHIYQQEEYQPIRFLRWMISTASIDKRATPAILFLVAIGRVFPFPAAYAEGFAVCILLAIALSEKDPRKASKKRLVMTGRASRIYWLAFALLVVVGLLYMLPGVELLSWIVPILFVPVALVVANLLLTPYEQHLQQGFWNEAHNKLKTLKPVVIGITGSYGKTSTKHLLGHILEIQAPTLVTPGSVNTPMGIARIVREKLGTHHRYFVCEMGAYGPGSIARLCRLAPPDAGVLTAIGMAHYERFKSLETVAKAKLELAESVAERRGDVVFSEQTLEMADVREFRQRYLEKTAIVGSGLESTFRIGEAEQTAEGIRATVTWQEQEYRLQAPLYGEHHIGNMAVAFATACRLGIPPANAVTALASAPQIAHRLEVKEGVNGSRLIDDAYNSNPVGFHSALNLLSQLQRQGGRRILVTPGMVELGTAHEEEHRKIGVLAAHHVDVLLPVLPGRIKSLVDAYKAGNAEGLVIGCSNFTDAQKWMTENVRSSDVVLLENDLPDLYERKLTI